MPIKPTTVRDQHAASIEIVVLARTEAETTVRKHCAAYHELERAMRVESSTSLASHARTGEPNCNMYPLLS